MSVLGRGLVFQPVLSACTYNNDTIIILQKKNRHYRFPSKRQTDRDGERQV